jgi:hypothetical protein
MTGPIARRIAARKAEQPKKPAPVRPPWMERLQAKEFRHVG